MVLIVVNHFDLLQWVFCSGGNKTITTGRYIHYIHVIWFLYCLCD